MRVIGVIDLRGGRAVRAYAGQRDRYQPIGDAVDLAHLYVDRYKLRELYVADLDAIEAVARPFQGRDPVGLTKPARHVIRQIADLGVALWLDAGTASVEGARRALDLGATRVVVGLETLPSFDVLRSICAAIDPEHAAFSLDLRGGTPIAGRGIPHETPQQLAARAAEAGVASLIVIDLARVGTGAGVDVELLAGVRQAAPGVALFAGGGVRDAGDLDRLAAVGCDGALVATALDALYVSATR